MNRKKVSFQWQCFLAFTLSLAIDKKNVEMISNLQFNQICVNVMIFIDHIKADAC